MESEAALGSNMSYLATPSMDNRGSDTPASDEVKRTGLQPQVDSQEIGTKAKKDQDKIMAIDATIQRFDNELPKGESEEDGPKFNKFKWLWDKFKKKWEEIKVRDESPVPGEDNGLASTLPDKNYIDTMQQHPNMVPEVPNQGPGYQQGV
jgi:hypothetical protein